MIRSHLVHLLLLSFWTAWSTGLSETVTALPRGEGLRLESLQTGVSALCPTEEVLSVERPHVPGTPTPVAVGVLVRDLVAISDVDQTFTVDMVFVLHWQDSRLADSRRGKDYSYCELPEGGLWTPVVEIQSARQQESFHRDLMLIDAAGNILQIQRFNLELSTPLDLRDFPFDSQSLRIRVEPVFSGTQEMTFSVLEDLTGRLDTLSIAGWEVGAVSARVGQRTGEVRRYEFAFFEYELEVARDPGFYIRKLIIPLLLITMMSWAVFWLPPGLLAPQIGLAATSILTLIAYQFALANFLPRISYPTRADSFILWSTVIVFLALVEAIATGILAHTDRADLAAVIDRQSRWAFPFCFLMIVGFAFWI